MNERAIVARVLKEKKTKNRAVVSCPSLACAALAAETTSCRPIRAALAGFTGLALLFFALDLSWSCSMIRKFTMAHACQPA